MRDSPGRQAVRQPDKLEASSADMSFITKGTCDLTRCKLEPTKGKIKWKTYIVKINYWQAAVSCSGARRRSYSRNSRDAAQTTKTMAKETQRRQRANASCQSWQHKQKVRTETEGEQRRGREQEEANLMKTLHHKQSHWRRYSTAAILKPLLALCLSQSARFLTVKCCWQNICQNLINYTKDSSTSSTSFR